ncbi:transposable element tc3 transposase, putative [Perkinsus marinus ATCC 50983]|uniref:Transposable element tc3 transposase, putative n=1 Tax=Perkinsus marinus (strain ATCC 50983 / TXsc) TaxID=423536 RepID=C5LMK3_PERM5|nr:transposable element tc3 transposase, putative [Perkinsus marinus ATCC 50983]EER02020.1 transposable element tc3 transposase, putative [Perkinsus marinus ATCC 50983]|eukprot:XP_002769302.1 transposable element tc3 transposase, putative [Perkinsus marinus ATCC 50983]
MNSEVYQSMLEMNLLPFLEAGEEEGIEYTFQQDNARPHVSSSTKEWLARNGVTTVQWPAVSPDLNCIEHCWGRMALAVYGGGRGPYSTKDELRQAIFKAWDDLTPEDISTLTKSTRSRCVEAIKCQGGPTSDRNVELQSQFKMTLVLLETSQAYVGEDDEELEGTSGEDTSSDTDKQKNEG